MLASRLHALSRKQSPLSPLTALPQRRHAATLPIGLRSGPRPDWTRAISTIQMAGLRRKMPPRPANPLSCVTNQNPMRPSDSQASSSRLQRPRFSHTPLSGYRGCCLPQAPITNTRHSSGTTCTNMPMPPSGLREQRCLSPPSSLPCTQRLRAAPHRPFHVLPCMLSALTPQRACTSSACVWCRVQPL